MTRKIILSCRLSPGDVVMLTAAVRDLHVLYPDQFITDVRSPSPDLWSHNPNLSPLDEQDPEVEVIECQYPLIHQSNQRPYHFIHGFMQHLSQRLEVNLTPTAFKGDLYLSPEERRLPFQLDEFNDRNLPLWLICAGGKYDFTIKWWSRRRYQKVVDRFQDRIFFIQIGEAGHYHPPLKNVHDLRGKTSIRELVRLVYQAQGVLSGVTLLMHLAAAVPLGPRQLARPAVVIAGGREAPHWEAYPTHQFLHAVGLLPCCASGGCWRSRTVALGDGDERDHPRSLCCDVVAGLPRCMDMISTDQVTLTIESVLAGLSARAPESVTSPAPLSQHPLQTITQ